MGDAEVLPAVVLVAGVRGPYLSLSLMGVCSVGLFSFLHMKSNPFPGFEEVLDVEMGCGGESGQGLVQKSFTIVFSSAR